MKQTRSENDSGPQKDKAEDTAAALIPPKPYTHEQLKRIAAGCRACPLWERGTQTVFGEGLTSSRLMLVGMQPGDAEDREGRPFVGPAGRVLDKALDQAGIDRKDAYVTNAVKHFKWVPKGRLRLHQKPNAREIGACLPWLEAEIGLIRPEVIVAMGATAAQILGGKDVRVTRDRGRMLSDKYGSHFTVTVHPSSILRAPTDEGRHRAMAQFVEDFKKIAKVLKVKSKK